MRKRVETKTKKCFELLKDLSIRGFGLDKKSAEVISAEEVDIIWCKGILGRDTPKKLLDILVFQ